MYEKITQKMRPTYSDPGAFICKDDLIAIWSDTQDIRQTFEPHSLSQQIMAQMKDVRLLKVLSIFILIEWPDIGQFERFLDTFPVDRDWSLPLQKEQLHFLSNPYKDLFYQKQYLFCPLYIENRDTAGVIIKDSKHPLPFVGQIKEVGSGGYGRVYVTKIAPHSYREPENNTDNPTENIVAFKKIADRVDFGAETKNLDFLKESLREHKHITLHLAAIIHGSDFYIFLPYTELGSLEVFLCEGVDESSGTDLEKVAYDFDQTFPPDSREPVHMLKQLANLAGALDFLHDGLEIGGSTSFYCAHLDLRPQNLLVFSSKTDPLGSWKISDFGISSFRKIGHTKERTIPSIRDFADHQDLRSSNGDDAFFKIEETASNSSAPPEHFLKESVAQWLQDLSANNPIEKTWIEDCVSIAIAILKIAPADRLKAREVHQRLGVLLNDHFSCAGKSNHIAEGIGQGTSSYPGDNDASSLDKDRSKIQPPKEVQDCPSKAQAPFPGSPSVPVDANKSCTEGPETKSRKRSSIVDGWSLCEIARTGVHVGLANP
ncbi:MAG: hypothetical protein Q9190_004738 [Brigantiaea leucoxantha]